MAGKTYKYGVFGVGCIGKVHASIVQQQGHQIVAIGDEAQAAIDGAQEEIALAGVRTFRSSPDGTKDGAGDAVIIASHTKFSLACSGVMTRRCFIRGNCCNPVWWANCVKSAASCATNIRRRQLTAAED